MEALVVYYSKFGHTKLLAERIADTLQLDEHSHVIDIEGIDPAVFSGANLVIMGSPTHKMNLPDAVDAVLDGLPKKCLRGAHVAAFDTSYRMNSLLARFTAAKKLDRKMRKLGGKRIVPPETFFVAGREGPLEEGELERAAAWARQLAARF